MGEQLKGICKTQGKIVLRDENSLLWASHFYWTSLILTLKVFPGFAGNKKQHLYLVPFDILSQKGDSIRILLIKGSCFQGVNTNSISCCCFWCVKAPKSFANTYFCLSLETLTTRTFLKIFFDF
ncbi:hypothetical protein ACEW7V_01890 [Areca yellow leaf disease phytoplasma]|uniref:hypothetical protein n=1 Tax=Areca yellow leaf disease phytoplasma TaxID=927614 RepID=UPI0035B505D8